MNARKLKTLAVLLGISTMVLMNSGANAKARGGDSGGGGDASEVRVNEIRSDILNWINNGGAKNLVLPSSLSYGEYESQMKEILRPKNVVIGFIEKDDENNDELKVNVAGTPKTCRGFISATDSKAHVICNISRFKNTSESEQYKLIHHEFAGLVNVENNEGAASDYVVSSQITDFLTQQTVLKLAVKNKSLDEEVIQSTYFWQEASSLRGLCSSVKLEARTTIKKECSDNGKKAQILKTEMGKSNPPYIENGYHPASCFMTVNYVCK